MKTRVVVLLSGAGSLCDALLAACAEPGYPAEVVAVGSDNPTAGGLEKARARGVETFVVPMERLLKLGSPERAAWERELTEAVAAHAPDLVVSAGFMKLLGPDFMARFGDRLLNTHPSLLPAFPGAHAVRDALAAGATQTGASIFWVDEGVDTGALIAQRPVDVVPGDDEATLHERIKVVERELLVDTIAKLATPIPEETL